MDTEVKVLNRRNWQGACIQFIYETRRGKLRFI